MLEKEKREIAKEFQVEDLGELHYVVGMSIVRNPEKRTMSITQKKYLKGVLKKFDMENCKPVSTPLEFGKKYEELSKGTLDIGLVYYGNDTSTVLTRYSDAD